MNLKKVIVGISGGVDSAVAALLLKLSGLNVHGVFMKNWDEFDESGACSGEKDWIDAQWICKKINIPLTQVNFVKEYWNYVFLRFLEDYENGFTPNPDILCNRHIKFDYFYNFAINTLKADAIATGHYARNSFGNLLENFKENKNARLLKAKDSLKDQTFFLSQIPQIALKRTMFPLGDLKKDEVKEIALKYELNPVLNKRESVGICFIGSRNFQHFISEYITNKPGNFIDIESGKIVGQHNGIHNWTIGQCCRISGCPQAYFVFRKDLNSNNILIVPGTDNKMLFTQYIYTSKPYWINENPIKNFSFPCEFRFQHTKPLVNCKIYNISEDSNSLLIKLEKPLRAITPGQYAVFYSKNECLGNARIISPGPYALQL